MSTGEFEKLLLAATVLLLGAHLTGAFFTRLRQPRVIGEIAAGVLLGPTLLGRLAPEVAGALFGPTAGPDYRPIGLGFLSHLGLLLLMFVSGAEVRTVFDRSCRRQTAWILIVGAAAPFAVSLVAALLLPSDALMGSAGSREALALVIAAAVTVTSIPVITRIFFDLGILNTPFASLLLGAALLEDILLWGVFSIAAVLASQSMVGDGAMVGERILVHSLLNAAYVLLALTVLPGILWRLASSRFNVIARQAPVTWTLLILLAYVAAAGALDVTPVFGAFLAGIGLTRGLSRYGSLPTRQSLEAIGSIAHGFFVPLYFAIVGLRLDFSRQFSWRLTLAFLVGSSLLSLSFRSLAALLAGFRGVPALNVAVTGNDRGGPGIVMASAALEAGIISATFCTAMVVTAVLTAQLCGLWLQYVLRKGWALLGQDVAHREAGHAAAAPRAAPIQGAHASLATLPRP